VRRAALIVMCLAVAWFPAWGAAAEHSVKAAYVVNILRFAERQGTAPQGALFVLAVYAAGPVEPSLLTLEGSTVRGRKLHIRIVRDETELRGCDALFLGRAEGRGARMLTAAGAFGLLTIGIEREFILAGGMVDLAVESHRIVVEVNPNAVAGSGWTLSSQLLELARLVRTGKT
jgi:hypothetical protein